MCFIKLETKIEQNTFFQLSEIILCNIFLYKFEKKLFQNMFIQRGVLLFGTPRYKISNKCREEKYNEIPPLITKGSKFVVSNKLMSVSSSLPQCCLLSINFSGAVVILNLFTIICRLSLPSFKTFLFSNIIFMSCFFF